MEKIIKIIIKNLFILLFSMLFNLFVFYELSWYAPWDIPTKSVLFRFIFLVTVVDIIINVIIYLYEKNKRR